MSDSPRTSLIIPAYFVDESFDVMTAKCLDSLKYGMPDEVLVVDDGSPYTPQLLHSCRLICNPQNGGYASAVNLGLSEAKGEILIIANNDIQFLPGWLDGILYPLEQGYDIASIRTSDNGWETTDKLTEGDKFGSLWAMTREAYEGVGALDESYGKGYFEDLDYRKRAINGGYKIAKNHACLVEHQAKATFQAVDPGDEHYQAAMNRYIDLWGALE